LIRTDPRGATAVKGMIQMVGRKRDPGLPETPLGEGRFRAGKRYGSILFLTLLLFFLGNVTGGPARAASQPRLQLGQADQCRKALESSSQKMKYRHNWMKCIHLYQEIYTRYPQSDEAGWALYQAAGLFRGLYRYSGQSKDLDESLRLYRQLTESSRTHRLADDAQYLIGEIYYDEKDDPSQAYVEFLKVDIKFPSGDMRPRARKKLDELSATLTKKSEEKSERNDNTDSKPASAAVKDIRHWSTPNYTRVVIDLDNPVKYEQHLLKADPGLKKPRRLYIDLQGAFVTSEIDSAIPIKDGLLQRARAGQYTKDTVRVVLDIESLGGYKVFHLYDPFRIVVDVRRLETEEDRTGEAAKNHRRVRRGIRKAETPDTTVSLARQLGLSVKTIVIDPGHGGKDPGCYARRSTQEKDIVLKIAKILADKIRKKLGCEVYLTRTTDAFLPLERRTAIANMKKADLFISLHINAHRDRTIEGLETYFLNMATDENAVMVAARENATSEKNISDLQTILNDLMMNTKIHESSRLAHKIQAGMLAGVKPRHPGVKDLGVKQAPFYVLIGAQMPAVLVEAGFLTNPKERGLLLGKAYQERVAEGICNGILSYVKSIDQVYRGG
jgi:N-acetylmuramoyl-L-alanine amidase